MQWCLSYLVERTTRVSRAGSGRRNYLFVVVTFPSEVKLFFQVVGQTFLLNSIIFPLTLSVHIVSDLPRRD